jgi:hypothetical protein
MRADGLDRRVSLLEAKRSDVDGEETRAFLAKLTYAELSRLEDICLRTDEWQKEPTEEEACFFAELRAKYAVQMDG